MYDKIKIHVNSFEEAANIVAHEFFKDMQESGYETFEGLCQCYWWSSEDVKEEVDAILTMETNNAWMWDDMTHVQIGIDDVSYRDFKKMYLSKIKELCELKNR